MRSIGFLLFVCLAIGCGNELGQDQTDRTSAGKNSVAALKRPSKGGGAASEKGSPTPADPTGPVRVLWMETGGHEWPSRIPRELARQALLAEARAKCDVVIRDAALGEVPPPGVPAEEVLDVHGSVFGRLKAEAKRHSKRDWTLHESTFESHVESVRLPASYTQGYDAEKSSAGLL